MTTKTVKIPESHRDLLDGPVPVTLATIMPDGQPQLSVVWCNTDGDFVLVNTARGRQKDTNMRQRPKVTILAIDPKNPYRYLEVRGEVVEMTEEGALEHINQLAKLYVGVDNYYGGLAPEEQKHKETRVMAKIRPTRVIAFGNS
ncbi:MAG: PPOX class F420-dependent oxidoreductase [Chloroflexi bacterium]|nr:MAG: PPOX class F420-dependent oxidoreductase [Chloroflexota bacterium]